MAFLDLIFHTSALHTTLITLSPFVDDSSSIYIEKHSFFFTWITIITFLLYEFFQKMLPLLESTEIKIVPDR